MLYGKKVSVTITAAETESAVADLRSLDICALEIPALVTNAAVTLKVCNTVDGTFRTLLTSVDNSPWTVASGVEDCFAPCFDLAMFPFAKVVIGAAQAANATFAFVGRG